MCCCGLVQRNYLYVLIKKSGKFSDRKYPLGYAWKANDDVNAPIDNVCRFLPCKNAFSDPHIFCATMLRQYTKRFKLGKSFPCDLIILICVTCDSDDDVVNSTKPRSLTFHYIKWKRNISPHKTVADAMNNCETSLYFACVTFEMKQTACNTNERFVGATT